MNALICALGTGAEASNGLPCKGRVTNKKEKTWGDGRVEWDVEDSVQWKGEIDGATNDVEAPLWGEGEGSEGAQRAVPQQEADFQQGRTERGRESSLGSEKISRGEGIRDRPGLKERLELNVNRTGTR